MWWLELNAEHDNRPDRTRVTTVLIFATIMKNEKSLSESVVRFIHPCPSPWALNVFDVPPGPVVIRVWFWMCLVGLERGSQFFLSSVFLCDCWTPRELLLGNWSICSSSCQILSSTGLRLQLGWKELWRLSSIYKTTTKSIWWFVMKFTPYLFLYLYLCSLIRIFVVLYLARVLFGSYLLCVCTSNHKPLYIRRKGPSWD